ncbi:right-handed parallel beta-helix repeat-containing protein [Salinigranum sp. GCM10025319]|uniref:right-handed parallel beta-helix repeat-containing protein n=1 Tax=Salinigranum sp. GCM10025319 TaxID=3252687 RepID=UPI003619BED9
MTTYYIDPAEGDDANAGTSLGEAFASLGPVESDGAHSLGPGDTVRLRDTAVLYPTEKPVWRRTAGTATDPITIEAYGGERPVIDCSNYDGHGIDLRGVRHLVWRGIEVRNVGKNAIRCLGIDGQSARNCTFEDLEVHHYGRTAENGTGLVLYGRSYDHTVRDVVAHHGGDSGDSNGVSVGGSNAAGRSGGHTFVRCEASHNGADGFDFFGSDSTRPSTLVDCRAHHNGTDGEGATGGGNGFDIGGGQGAGGTVLRRCLAWANTARGFDTNGASTRTEFLHCTAWNNGTYGFQFAGDEVHYARNCASIGNGLAAVGSLWNVDSASNTWDLGIESVSFVSTDAGSSAFLRPTADSPLVDAGTDVGMDFSGDAPDLGAVAAGGSSGSAPTTPTTIDDGTDADPSTCASPTVSGGTHHRRQ